MRRRRETDDDEADFDDGLGDHGVGGHYRAGGAGAGRARERQQGPAQRRRIAGDGGQDDGIDVGARILEDWIWPVQGGILQISADRKQIRLSHWSSGLFQPGMFIVMADVVDATENPPPEEAYYEVTTFAKNVMTLTRPLALELGVGSPFYTHNRLVPNDPAEFTIMDCAAFLQMATNDFQKEEFRTDSRVRLNWVIIADADDGTVDTLMQQYKSVKQTVSTVVAQCVRLGLHVTQPDAARTPIHKKFMRDLGMVEAVLNGVFVSALADRMTFRALDDPDAVTADDTYGALWNFSLRAPEVPRSDTTLLLEHALRMAHLLSLRHKDGIVYERVKTYVDLWRPLPTNPMCVVCNTAPAAFGPRNFGGGARQRCVEHKLPGDHDFRYVVGRDGERRMVEEERETRVIPAACWVPMMNGASEPMSIATWLNRQIDPDRQAVLWDKYIKSYGHAMTTMEKCIRLANVPQFPELTPDRTKFSFTNGVLDIKTHTFYAYGDGTLPAGVCCINHIKCAFDPEWLEVPVEELDVPGYDDILRCQEFSPEMVNWQDIMIGRLFYNLGELDNWEKQLIIKGWAATGKSSIVKAIVMAIGPSNVGNIPANCEEQWALATVYDKPIWMCTELKKTWPFNTATLQSMNSNETVDIHQKHLKAISKTWNSPGILVGNEEPTSWMMDPLGAMYRRAMIFTFEKPPREQNPAIARQLLANVGKLLVRWTRKYVAKTREIGDTSVDNALPMLLKAGSKSFLLRTTPLLRFLQETDSFQLAEDDQRRRMFGYLQRSAEGSAPQADDPTLQEVVDYKDAWHVSLTEINTKFRTWFSANIGQHRTSPSIVDKADYIVATNEMCLHVDTTVRGRPCIVGLRSANGGGGPHFHGGAAAVQ